MKKYLRLLCAWMLILVMLSTSVYAAGGVSFNSEDEDLGFGYEIYAEFDKSDELRVYIDHFGDEDMPKAKLIVAAYSDDDESIMIGAETFDLEGRIITDFYYKKPENAKSVKVCLWDGTEAIMPSATAVYAKDYQDNYGYVLNGDIKYSFNEATPRLQILHKDGTIGIYDFSSTVTIENPTDAIRSVVNDMDDFIAYSYNDHGSTEDVVNEVIGKGITFTVTDDVITYITLPSSTLVDGDTTLALLAVDTISSSSYDEEDKYIRIKGKKCYLNDDTAVFFIGGTSDYFEYGEVVNDTENCYAGTGAELKTISNVSAAAYVNASTDGYVDMLVLYNTDAGISLISGAAYVTNIATVLNDNKEVLSVQYYQDGELKTSVTDDKYVGDLDANTVLGSVFKFSFIGDTIISARTYLTFDGMVRDKAATNAGIPKVSKVATGINADEEVYFGVLLKKQSGKLTFATMDEDSIPNLAYTESFKTSRYDTNFYTYDPSKSDSDKFAVGSPDDIIIDKILTNDNGSDESLYDIIVDDVTIPAPAFGMLDYVFIRAYGEVADVIIYKAYEFDFDFDRK